MPTHRRVGGISVLKRDCLAWCRTAQIEIDLKGTSVKYFSKNNSSNGRQNAPAEKMKTMDLAVTNRVSVPAALYEEVKANVILNLPFLHRLDYIVPEDLVGIEFWCGLDDRQQRQAKACIAHMVHTRVLPISPREAWLESAHFYVLG